MKHKYTFILLLLLECSEERKGESECDIQVGVVAYCIMYSCSSSAPRKEWSLYYFTTTIITTKGKEAFVFFVKSKNEWMGGPRMACSWYFLRILWAGTHREILLLKSDVVVLLMKWNCSINITLYSLYYELESNHVEIL